MAAACDHGEVLPVTRRFHAIDVEQCAVAVVEQRTAGKVAVGHTEEFARLLPFSAPGFKTRRQHRNLASILFIGRKPYGKQVAVVTPCHRRLVVVAIKWYAVATLRSDDKRYRRQVQGGV